MIGFLLMAMAVTNFGRDTSCTTSLRTGRFVSGARLVAEACYRRLTTPRGRLRGGEDEADYGFDLNGLCGKTLTAQEIAALPGRIKTELSKDRRISPSSLTVNVFESTTSAGATSLDITIEAGTNEGPFELQLRIGEFEVSLLKLEAA